MAIWRRLESWLSWFPWYRRQARDADLARELRDHLDLEADEQRAAGLSPEEAAYAAHRALGNTLRIEEDVRAAWGFPWLETFIQDLHFGLRMLRKSPGFTAVAVLTLALGIGANTAIFSVVQEVLLKSLPFRDPARLVRVSETVGKEGGRNPVAYPNYLDWRAQNTVFREMAAFSDCEMILSGGDRSERVYCEQASDTYFPLLGVSAVVGRTFTPEENATPMKYAVALIGYGLWQRRFASDPQVIGNIIRLNDHNYTIIGVLPKGFLGYSDSAEVWIPMVMRDAAWPQVAQFDFLHNRDVHYHKVLARLKPGVSLGKAQAEMDTIAARLAKAYPKENRERGVSVDPVNQDYVRSFRVPLLVLLGAVGFVLLIACANVANLVLTRTSSRQRELAVRLALGAGRSRLIRQFFTEGLLLSICGGVSGVLLAYWGLHPLVSLLPASFPSFAQIRLDYAVLVFTFVLTLSAGVFLGTFPVLASARANVGESLKDAAKSTTGIRGWRTGGLLVISEVALALVLMIGAGLLLQSLVRLIEVNPGFRPDHLVTLRFYVPDRVREPDARNRFGPELAEQIAAVPGVESSTVTFIDPFVWGGLQRGFSIEGHAPISNAESDTVYFQEIGSNYFHTMGIPLEQGRDFTARDTLAAPRVLIVSEAFARRYWPGQSALGKRVKYGPVDSTSPWMEVVGVVGNIKYNSLRQDPNTEPVFYGPLLQSEVIINMSLIVRTRSAPEAVLTTLRDAIQRIDPEAPVYNMATLDQRLHEDSAEMRSYTFLLGLFAVLAVGLAAVGVYGVINHRVSQRNHELGVRLALGASRRSILWLVFTEVLRLALCGVALGLAGALALTRLLSGLLFEVRPFEPGVFGGLAVLLTAVALMACYIPARRAMRVDPLVALRYE
jgi:putative ABC transport system permease protein